MFATISGGLLLVVEELLEYFGTAFTHAQHPVDFRRGFLEEEAETCAAFQTFRLSAHRQVVQVGHLDALGQVCWRSGDRYEPFEVDDESDADRADVIAFLVEHRVGEFTKQVSVGRVALVRLETREGFFLESADPTQFRGSDPVDPLGQQRRKFVIRGVPQVRPDRFAHEFNPLR